MTGGCLPRWRPMSPPAPPRHPRFYDPQIGRTSESRARQHCINGDFPINVAPSAPPWSYPPPKDVYAGIRLRYARRLAPNRPHPPQRRTWVARGGRSFRCPAASSSLCRLVNGGREIHSQRDAVTIGISQVHHRRFTVYRTKNGESPYFGTDSIVLIGACRRSARGPSKRRDKERPRDIRVI